MSGRIIVHSLDDACAAVAAASALGVDVTLASAPGAGCYAGAAWFKSLVDQAASRYPATPVSAVLDCGDEPGTVLAALRMGLRHVRFTGPAPMRERLAALAAALGAVVEGDEPVKALDLLGRRNAELLCRAFLAGEGDSG